MRPADPIPSRRRGDVRPARQWFVHQDSDELAALLDGAGWRVESIRRRAGARTWLEVRAVARSVG